MKKYLLYIIMCMLPALGYAQSLAVTQRAVGYTDGDSITRSGILLGYEGSYSVGAMTTSELLAGYEGCKIVGIRFALAQSIGKSSVFLTPVKNGAAETDIVNQTVRRTSEGWNNVFFNAGNEYTITGDETLLFGFTYSETADMMNAGKGALSLYTPQTTDDNAFLVLGDFGSGMGWYNFANNGHLCVQLIIDVSSKPKKEITFSNMLIGYYYKKPGDKINYYVECKNSGIESFSNCDIAYQIDGGEKTIVHLDKTLPEGENHSFDNTMSLPADIKSGTHDFRFTVEAIDGVAPAKKTEISEKFVVYRETLGRQKHLMEQYNSQSSPYGYAVNNRLNGRVPANVCLVNVYEPQSPLRINQSDYLFPLYAYTYPCFTIDRMYFFGEQHIAFDVNDYVTIFPSLVESSVNELVTEANNNPAFATVNITPEYDSQTGNLHISVSGDVTSEAEDILGDIALTLMITENNVTGKQVNTSGQTVSGYKHQHVLRKYISAPTGDKLVITGNTYQAEYTVHLEDAWKYADLEVVGLVSKYAEAVTDDNVLQLDITNANSCSLSDVSAIADINADAVSSASQWYSINGSRINRVGTQRPGLYITRQPDGFRKVVVR